LAAQQGTSYWIGLFAESGRYRPLAFSFALLPIPDNDRASRATELAAEGDRVSGYTALSTREGDPGDADASGGGSVWYRWTPRTTGFATVILKGNPQAQPGVFSGTEPATALPVPVTTTPADSGERFLHFAVTSGVPVWIAIGVDEAGLERADGGLFELSVAVTDVALQSDALLLAEGDNLTLEARSSQSPEITLRLTGGPDGPRTPRLTNAPFRHTLSNLPPGRYEAVAVGLLDDGLRITSPPLSVRVAPTNDLFAQAADIGPLPVRLRGSLAGAADEVTEPILPSQAAAWTRWWTWQAPMGGRLRISRDRVYGLYQGASLVELAPVEFQQTDSANIAVVTAGTRYFLQIAPGTRFLPGLGPEPDPEFDLTLAMIPDNDRFEDRTPVSGSDLDLVANHAAAGTESEGIPGDPGFHYRSVWYSWTSPDEGWLVLEESTADLSRAATVFSGDSLERLRRLASSDFTYQPLVVPVAAGQRYEILLEERTSEIGPPAHWWLRWHPPVTNDDFAGRVVLTGNTAELTGITVGATRETGEVERRTQPQNRLLRNTVWYSWTAPETGWARLEQEPAADEVHLEPFEGDTLESLRSLWPEGWTFSPVLAVNFPVEKGRTYAFWIGTEGDQARPYRIRLHGPARPSNDDLGDAELVTARDPVLNGVTRGGTIEPGEPNTDPVSYPGTVWYRWTSPGRGALVATQSGSWLVSAWTGDRVDTLEPADYRPWIFGLRTEPGVTYLLRVAGYLFDSFQIPLTYLASPPNDDFANATRVAGSGDAVLGGPMDGATAERGESEESVWWRWIAPSGGLLSVVRESDHPVEVFRGISAAQVTVNPGRPLDWNRTDHVVARDLEYYLRASGRQDLPLRFRLVFTPDPVPTVEGASLGAGVLRLPVQGTPGRVVELEQSSDLVHWTPALSRWLLHPREELTLPVSDAPLLFVRPRP